MVNGKGGVGKTMTYAMLAAVYAREGGGNLLAWDNNDTRGTLGWRTEAGLYDTTVRDLLPAAETLLEPGAGVSDITRFVHHQSTDRYDVLRSNPELLATDQRIATAEFGLLMQVAARYYRLVIFDSGNDESADRWLRMIVLPARYPDPPQPGIRRIRRPPAGRPPTPGRAVCDPRRPGGRRRHPTRTCSRPPPRGGWRAGLKATCGRCRSSRSTRRCHLAR